MAVNLSIQDVLLCVHAQDLCVACVLKQAANFLDIKPMLNLTCKAVAEMIKGKSQDEIKDLFGVKGDFTEEEVKQVLQENPWLREPTDSVPA